MKDKKSKEGECYIYFSSGELFKKGDTINSFNNNKYLVLETPRNKWYHILLNIIFKKYKLTDKYKVSIIKKNNEKSK
jgi:hypothetical protein